MDANRDWSAAARADKYLKRGEGVGGGHIPGYSSKDAKKL